MNEEMISLIDPQLPISFDNLILYLPYIIL
jgi:hypothetical protein